MSDPRKCPVCDGSGVVERPMYQKMGTNLVESSFTAKHGCEACDGQGVLSWPPASEQDDAGAEAASPPMHLTTQCTTCGATGVVGGEKCQVCQGSGVNPYAPPPCPVCGIAYGSCDCAPKRIREITARLRAENERLHREWAETEQGRLRASEAAHRLKDRLLEEAERHLATARELDDLKHEHADRGRRLAEVENSEQRLALACHRLLSDFRAALGRRPIRAADETIVEAEVALEKRARKLLEEGRNYG